MSEDASLVLRATGVTYYHPNDEAAFFEWLDRMECVESYDGAGRDLFLRLRRRPNRHDLIELLGFFQRYGVDMTQLAKFETRSNRAWLRDPGRYWHSRMFPSEPRPST